MMNLGFFELFWDLSALKAVMQSSAMETLYHVVF